MTVKALVSVSAFADVCMFILHDSMYASQHPCRKTASRVNEVAVLRIILNPYVYNWSFCGLINDDMIGDGVDDSAFEKC